jgi:CspA family cold shock protein
MSNIEFSDSSTEPVVAHLKWFNNPRGFGFLVPEDKEVDAFVHITTLQNAGIKSLGDGASMLCHIEYGPKGAMVKQIVDLLDKGDSPLPIPNGDDYESAETSAQKMGGTVKWYKPDKGFGFIVPDDGKKDIFIHETCLDKHDIKELEQGQRLSMVIKTVPKGREVVEFEFET